MSQKLYMCTNCHWSGTPNQMEVCGDALICPDCCAEFDTHNPDNGPWMEVFPDTGENDPNFNDSDWDGFGDDSPDRS